MYKHVIWTLGGLGLVILLAGLVGKSALPIIVGLGFLAAAVVVARAALSTLTKEQTSDSWSTQLDVVNGKSEVVLQETSELIREAKVPNVRLSRRQMVPGVVRAIGRERREFLVVDQTMNSRLEPYQIYVNAHDFGATTLSVSWYLSFTPTTQQALFALVPYARDIHEMWTDLDLFDQQDLRDFVTVVHHCVLKSVDNLMQSLEQDPSKIERKSRGLLGIS